MAELSDNDRAAEWAAFMQEDDEGCSITKAELRAAVDAIDVWLNDNAAAANNAIPQPARSALTTRQKARLLMHVVRRRYLVE
jgi:hypothetical protein